MTRKLGVLAGCVMALALSRVSVAQTAKMEFDVASVRQNKAEITKDSGPSSNFPLGPGAMYSPNGGTFSATKMPLFIYIMFAYKMSDHEVQALQKQLPAWALEERYDIQAKTDKHDATKDEMRLMMQSLLAERFKLAVHMGSEETPVFGLEVAKPGKLGPKLRVHPADGPPCSNDIPSAPKPGETAAPQMVEGGFPAICGGAAALPGTAHGHIEMGFRNVPLALIASQMQGFGGLDRPVVDMTGLDGKYDFAMSYTRQLPPDVTPPADWDTEGVSFQQALLEQTGLKLVPSKHAVEVVLIDHIEHLVAE